MLPLLSLLALHPPVLAGPGPLAAPPPPGAGYTLIAEDAGAALYEQPWDTGAPDYLLVVDLTEAWVSSMLDPSGSELSRHTAAEAWDRSTAEGAFAVLNGAFFSTASDPTSPAFGLRSDPHGYIHAGYGTDSEFVGQQRALHVRNEATRAAIVTADPDSLWDAERAPEQVVALDPDADKSATSWIQRTFAGVADPYDEGHRTLIFFVSEVATQEYAEGELTEWGAVTTMMFDGGGSTQLTVQGVDLVASTRAVPQLFLIQSWRPAADTGTGDTGSTDAGSTDAGSTDAGSTDAGSTDAGSTDTGPGDAGTATTDGGSAGSPTEPAGTRSPADPTPACGCQAAPIQLAGALLALLAIGRRRVSAEQRTAR